MSLRGGASSVVSLTLMLATVPLRCFPRADAPCSCVFVLVTAFASLLHRAFTITNEVSNSQPIPNTFLHGMCLCSMACHRAFIYSVPVRYTNQVLSLGPQQRHQHEGLGTSSTGLAHALGGSLAAELSLTSSSWAVFCWQRAHLSSEVGVLKCRWRCTAK